MKDSIDIPIIHEAKEWIVIHDLTDNNIYSSLANQSNYWYLLISGIVTFILVKELLSNIKLRKTK